MAHAAAGSSNDRWDIALLRIVARLLRDFWLQLAALRCRLRCEGAAKSLIHLTPFPD